MRNRGIGRARIFMGAVLLLAAVVTWGIGLTMSSHGEGVARGTDYVRTTVVTFKRNGAIGTLILCALGAWLLFPIRRPKWPVRDWALMGVLALLFATSVYTLVSLRPFASSDLNVDENFAVMNADAGANTFATERRGVTASQAPQIGSAMNAAIMARSDLTRRNEQERSAVANVAEEESDAEDNHGSPPDADEPAKDESDLNQQ